MASGAPAVSLERLALMQSAGPLPKIPKDLNITQEQMQRMYYRTTQSTDVPGRQPQKEADENYLDIHSIGQRPTKYLPVDGFKAPLVNRLACNHTQAYTPHALGDNVVNKALAANFKAGFGAPVAMYKPLGGEPGSHAEYPEYEPELMAKANQKNMKPKVTKAGGEEGSHMTTNTLNGCGGSCVTKSHEQSEMRAPRLDILKAKKAKKPQPGLDIGGDGRPVRGRSAYDMQFGIEQATVQRKVMAQNASLPALGQWKSGLFPASAAVPDMHPVMQAGKTMKRMPMMSPGQ